MEKHEQEIINVDHNFTGGMLSRDQILNKLSCNQNDVMEISVTNKQTVAKIYQAEMDNI